jgi:carbamoyl-phosphate synthase small subunit
LKTIIASGIPIFGIGLGHQLLALANGFTTYKMKLGHRGANIPVKDLTDGRVYIAHENHGYAVARESIDTNVADEWFVNINDNTCEGFLYKNSLAFSVQFNIAGDTEFALDRFMEVIANAAQ